MLGTGVKKIDGRRGAPIAESKSAAAAVMLVTCVIIGCMFSLYIGKDLNWDLRNYHFYNPWALLNGRFSVDGYPAQLQSFFNPLLDLPFYLISTSFPDYVTVFLAGVPAGVAFYLIWISLPLLFESNSGAPTLIEISNRGMAGALAVLGAAGLSQINTTTGEWAVSSLVLLAIWSLLSMARDRIDCRAASLIAGLSLGAAAALKLTAAVPALAITLSAPLLLRWTNARASLWAICAYVLAGTAAFLVLMGPWMWTLYSHFGNPLFPFFNGLFRSPLLDGGSMLDSRFLPATLLSALDFPLVAALHRNHLHTEIDMRDPRLLIGSVISLTWIAALVRSILRHRKIDRINAFLALTFVATYAAWMVMFGIYRYVILLEILAMMMACKAVGNHLGNGNVRLAASVALLAYGSAALLTVSPSFGRSEENGGPYFPVDLPKLPPGAIVLNLTTAPVGYLAPLWPGHPPLLSPVSNLTEPGYNGAFQQEIYQRVVRNKGPIYALRDDAGLTPPMIYLADQYRIKVNDGTCVPVDGAPFDHFRVCETAADQPNYSTGFDASSSAGNKALLGGYLPVAPGDNAVWVGQSALVSFSKSELKSGRDLVIAGWLPFGMSKKKTENTDSVSVNVSVNATVVRSQAFSADGPFLFRIRPDELKNASTGYASIGVVVRSSNLPLSPKAIGAGQDERRLGMRISRISFDQ